MIKSIFSCLCFAFFSVGILFGQDTKPDSFSLADCLEFATQHAMSVRKAELDVEISGKKVEELLSQAYPQVNGNVQFTNNFKLQTSFLPAAFFAKDPKNPPPPDAPPVAVEFGVQYSGMMMAQVQQLIFDGSFFLGLKAARVFQALAQKNADRTKIELVAQVTKAYYAVLVNQERLGLLQQNYIRLDTILRQTRLMCDAGFSEKIDADRLEVAFNNIKSEQRKVERMVNLSLSLLKFQMGMPQDTPLQLSETLHDVQFKDNETTEKPDYANRIEFAQIETQLKLDEVGIKRFQVQYFPTLYAVGNLGLTSGGNKLSAFERWYWLGSYGLKINIPIFDGFRKRASIQQARLALRKTQIEKENLLNAIDLEVAQAKINLENAVNEMKTQGRNMALAKEVARVANLKFTEGVGATLEMVNAEAAYKEAETNYYLALYEALLARTDYRKATGKL